MDAAVAARIRSGTYSRALRVVVHCMCFPPSARLLTHLTPAEMRGGVWFTGYQGYHMVTVLDMESGYCTFCFLRSVCLAL